MGKTKLKANHIPIILVGLGKEQTNEQTLAQELFRAFAAFFASALPSLEFAFAASRFC